MNHPPLLIVANPLPVSLPPRPGASARASWLAQLMACNRHLSRDVSRFLRGAVRRGAAGHLLRVRPIRPSPRPRGVLRAATAERGRSSSGSPLMRRIRGRRGHPRWAIQITGAPLSTATRSHNRFNYILLFVLFWSINIIRGLGSALWFRF